MIDDIFMSNFVTFSLKASLISNWSIKYKNQTSRMKKIYRVPSSKHKTLLFFNKLAWVYGVQSMLKNIYISRICIAYLIRNERPQWKTQINLYTVDILLIFLIVWYYFFCIVSSCFAIVLELWKIQEMMRHIILTLTTIILKWCNSKISTNIYYIHRVVSC